MKGECGAIPVRPEITASELENPLRHYPARHFNATHRSRTTMAAASTLSASVRIAPSRTAIRSTNRVVAKAPVRAVRAEAAPEFAGLGPEMKGAVDKFLGENKIVLFMKGNKEQPKCGFSNTVVQIFKSMDVPFETVDILQDDGLRAGMKIYSQWPTFPQVYIDGEFYGGCDICIDTYKDGSLVEAVEASMAS